jgi:hypothetical protein
MGRHDCATAKKEDCHGRVGATLARILFAMWRDEVAYDAARIRSSQRTLVPTSDDGVTRPA